MLYRLKNLKSLLIGLAALCFITLPFYFEFQTKRQKSLSERTGLPKIHFWQYWTGAEREPLQALVEKFNAEFSAEYGFEVEMLTISMPRKKILMSIVGNVSPDLMHLDDGMVADFANRNALLALDTLILEDMKSSANQGFEGDQELRIDSSEEFLGQFIPVYIEMLNINKHQWALPMMPTIEAMHVNTQFLAKHNLKAPETLDDLQMIFETATDFENFTEIAWLPSWPPWTGRFIPIVFGGSWGHIHNGEAIITANHPRNIEAWTWVQENFASKIPKQRLAAFTEGFNAYQSPDNPFYTGRIAIENNGVWEKHLAATFATDLDIAIKAFPTKADYPLASLVTADALAIPKGARYPQQALKFMQWLLQEENIEKLAIAQHKFSPLKTISEGFVAQHPNPYIQVFIDLANSPNAKYFPPIKLTQKYRREIKDYYTKVLRMEISPEEALNQIQELMESSQ